MIVGLLVFLLLEKMFPDQDSQEDATSDSDLNFNSAVSIYAEIVCFQKNLHSVIQESYRSPGFPSHSFVAVCHTISQS